MPGIETTPIIPAGEQIPVGLIIRFRRRSLEMSIKTLAELVEREDSTISNIERGNKDAGEDLLAKIAEALGFDSVEKLTGASDKQVSEWRVVGDEWQRRRQNKGRKNAEPVETETAIGASEGMGQASVLQASATPGSPLSLTWREAEREALVLGEEMKEVIAEFRLGPDESKRVEKAILLVFRIICQMTKEQRERRTGP